MDLYHVLLTRQEGYRVVSLLKEVSVDSGLGLTTNRLEDFSGWWVLCSFVEI